jgi:hypothetical protein
VPPYRGATGGYIYPLTGPPPLYSPDGDWFVYGSRVPLLVVSPYTKAEYVSGSIAQGSGQGKFPPYVHDFGSILGFIEAAFNLPPYVNAQNTCGIAGAIDPTSGCTYPFADFFAPDGQYECTTNYSCGTRYAGYPLADFFNLSAPRTTFPTILGFKYAPNCFVGNGPSTTPCFGPNFQPGDPDNDAIDTED